MLSFGAYAPLKSLILNSCNENNSIMISSSILSIPKDPSNSLLGEYISLSEFMPSELILQIKPNNQAVLSMNSYPITGTYTIEDKVITIHLTDGSRQVFIIDTENEGSLIHDFTKAVFVK